MRTAVLLLLCLFFSLQCQAQEKQIVLLVEPIGVNSVHFYYYDEFGDLRNFVVKKDAVDKEKRVIISSSKPLMLRFTRNIQQFPVYVIPGDTIRVSTSPQESLPFKFHGKRQEEINFFAGLELKNCGIGIVDYFGMDMKSQLDRKASHFKDLYSQRLRLLNKASDSLYFTPAFYTFAVKEFQNQYMTAMLVPFSLKDLDSTQISPEYIAIVQSFRTNGWLNQGTHFYSSLYSRNVLDGYNRFQTRRTSFTDVELSAAYDNIHKNFTGIEKNFLLFSFIKRNLEKGYPGFNAYIDRFMIECSYKPYQLYVDSLVNRYSRLVFQDEVLESELIKENNERVTWKQVLQQNKGKVVYIDFWASWCGPCIEEMPHSKELQKKLKAKAVAFVNISIDTSPDKWAKAMQKLSFPSAGVQNYLIDSSGPLSQFLQLPPIPRYVLIDKNGKVFALDAKRPSNLKLVNDIEALLNN
jgi:thiol-disulfide isomerase/thioredoxin